MPYFNMVSMTVYIQVIELKIDISGLQLEAFIIYWSVDYGMY